ncbi:MAG TPA: hypothetical protein VN408_01410 [Actinoplanes sp.]|nr:hypothetical protein [Actinoplanes sp.]
MDEHERPAAVRTRSGAALDLTTNGAERDFLRRLRGAANPAGLPVEQHLFDQLADLLKQETVTTDGRAAAYRALALMPGIVVAEDTVVLGDATGTAFALQGNRDDQVVIEPGTGRFVGSRLVLAEDYGVLPAGAVLESTAVTVDVTGSAPVPTGTAPPVTRLPR